MKSSSDASDRKRKPEMNWILNHDARVVVDGPGLNDGRQSRLRQIHFTTHKQRPSSPNDFTSTPREPQEGASVPQRRREAEIVANVS